MAGAGQFPEKFYGHIVFDAEGTPITFKPVGGITVGGDQVVSAITEDGKGVVGHVMKPNENCVIKAFIRVTDIDTNAAAIYGSTVSTDELAVINKSGTELDSLCKVVYIKPIIDEVVDTDDSHWWVFPKVAPPIKVGDHTLDLDNQVVIPVEFYYYSSNGVYYKYGLNTA